MRLDRDLRKVPDVIVGDLRGFRAGVQGGDGDGKGIRLMRMWMVDPATMCDQHLLGEHVELHMLAGTLSRGRSIAGFIAKGLLEPASMQNRHAVLVAEMTSRGFRHRSPLAECDLDYLPQADQEARVDVRIAAQELARRCERCRARAGGHISAAADTRGPDSVIGQ